MQINLDAVIHDLHGKPIKTAEGSDQRDYTLGDCIAQAAVSNLKGDENASANDKVKRFKLATLAMSGGTKEFSVEQLATAKDVIGRAFLPLIVGRAFALIEGTAEQDNG